MLRSVTIDRWQLLHTLDRLPAVALRDIRPNEDERDCAEPPLQHLVHVIHQLCGVRHRQSSQDPSTVGPLSTCKNAHPFPL